MIIVICSRSIDIHPINEGTYETLVLNGSPGVLLIMVFIDSTSRDTLLQRFASIAYPYSRYTFDLFDLFDLFVYFIQYRLYDSTSL